VPDKTLFIDAKDLLRRAIWPRLMQADHPVAHLIESLFRDRVVDQWIIARVLVDPDPRSLHDPHHANTDQFFQRLADGETRDAILFGQLPFRGEFAWPRRGVLIDFAQQILGHKLFLFHCSS